MEAILYVYVVLNKASKRAVKATKIVLVGLKSEKNQDMYGLV